MSLFSPNIRFSQTCPKETRDTLPLTSFINLQSTQLNPKRAGLQNECTLGCFIASLPGHERWLHRRPQGLTNIQGKSIRVWRPWKMMGLEEVISFWNGSFFQVTSEKIRGSRWNDPFHIIRSPPKQNCWLWMVVVIGVYLCVNHLYAVF